MKICLIFLLLSAPAKFIHGQMEADSGLIRLSWDMTSSGDQLGFDAQVLVGEALFTSFESDWIALLSGRVTGA